MRSVEMAKYAEDTGFWSGGHHLSHSRWGVSRQRFWGAPVRIIYCEKCGMFRCRKRFAVRLPYRAEFTGSGESPLAGVADFVNTPP